MNISKHQQDFCWIPMTTISTGMKTLSSFLILCVQFISRLLISLQIRRVEDMKQNICDYFKKMGLCSPFYLGKVTLQTF